MQRITGKSPKLALMSSVALGLVAPNAYAQTSENPTETAENQDGLNVIIVTATKREEAAQDIGMSIQVVTGETLDNLSIDSFEDLSTTIPNFTVGDTLTVSQITMRGLGSGEDRGFETSVSTFKDGIYLPRGRQTRSPFFDVERVEVLRGPQAVLFGLNSTAGAISVHGKVNRPGDDFEISAMGEFELENSGYRGRVVAGGSLGDTLGVRVAYERLDSGKGWLNNPVSGRQVSQEHDIARVSLVWEPASNISLIGRYEYNKSTSDGQATEIIGADLNLAGDGANGGLFQRVAAINGLVPGSYDLSGEDNVVNFVGYHNNDPAFQNLHAGIDVKDYRDPLGADQEIHNGSLNFEIESAEGITVSAMLGYSEYFYDASVNIAGLGFSTYYGTNYEEYSQISGEVRISSPVGQTVEWIAGVYYHDGDLFTDQPNTFDVNQTLGLALGLPPAIVQAAVTGAPLYELAGASFDQNTKLLSPFFASTINVSDQFRLIGGLRYSDEIKSYVRDAHTPGSGLYLINPDGSLGTFLGGAILNANGAAVGRTTGKVKSRNWMPEVMLEYDVTGDVLLFARYAQSAKSGGVATAGSTAPQGIEFGDETATSFEIGMKGRFLNGNAELNVTAFRTNYNDLQVKSSAVSAAGPIVSVVDNAGQARSQGIEIDGRAQVADGIILGGNVSWLDANFTSYPNGPCNRSASLPAGPLAGTCNLSGQQLPFAADYSGSIYLDVEAPMGNVKLLGNATMSFSDSYNVEGTLEPTLLQGSWAQFRGRIGIADIDDKWTLAVIGTNLTNEKIIAGAQPLFGYNLVYPLSPRTITLQGVIKF